MSDPNQRKTPPLTRLPYLRKIHDEFVDAYSIVYCAAKTLYAYHGEKDDRAATFALRQGVNALSEVSDRLDEAATMQVSAFLKTRVGKRGAP
jgi:hypothetical protein